MKLDLLVMGEALVDFVPTHRGALRSATGFELYSGGAPANVAIGAARLGAQVAFVGVVGSDEFGWFLRHALERAGIDCSRLRLTDDDITGLCFITLDERGDRSFLHRGGDAASLLGPQDVDPEQVASAAAVMFSSIALRQPSGVEAVDRLLDHATGLVSCDPGSCPAHWGDPSVMKTRLRRALERCHVVKCSAEETHYVVDEHDPRAAAGALVRRYGCDLGVVTMGAEGAYWARAGDAGHVPAPPVGDVVDTTGAGDAFMAGLMRRLAAEGCRPRELTTERVIEDVAFACRIGAAAVTRRGAV